jgi:N-terminal domain of unknown function (DUF4140)
MRRISGGLAVAMVIGCVCDGALGAPVNAAGKITSVTVYQTSALVTREVEVPAGASEIIVGPLPVTTMNSSLYTEGTDGFRVLTTRYRTRVVQEDTQEEVRKLQTQIRDLQKDDERVGKQVQTIEMNLQLLGKLEGFTAGALQHMTEKGMLNSEQVGLPHEWWARRRTA